MNRTYIDIIRIDFKSLETDLKRNSELRFPWVENPQFPGIQAIYKIYCIFQLKMWKHLLHILKYFPSGRKIFRTILKIECLNSEFHSNTKMKSEIQGTIRFLTIFLLFNIKNAQRLRDMEGMAGIDRPCTDYAAYRFSPMPYTLNHSEINAIDIKLKDCTDQKIYEKLTSVDNNTTQYPTIGITQAGFQIDA